jgi:hypothetical protein
MDPPEGRDRRIDTRQFHRNKTVQQPAAAGGAVSPITHPADADLGHLGDDVEGKRIPVPIILDHRGDHAFGEFANTLEQRPLAFVQHRGYPVEIAVDRRRRVVLLFEPCHLRVRHGFLLHARRG